MPLRVRVPPLSLITGGSYTLTAARLVLEFTKAKPAAQAELTVRRAEDYLAEIAKDMVIEEDKE